MSVLGDLRIELAEALSSVDAIVYTHLPEVINAPALVITPGSPYVTSEGQPFGHYRANFSVVAVADVSTNEVTTEALDALVGSMASALAVESIPVSEVGEPYAFQSSTAFHLAADVAVTLTFKF